MNARVGEARVLVVGAGGLGAPALWALADAGVRHLGIMEPDRVELSNLHRQILYRECDVGQPKAEVAARVLAERYPGTEVEVMAQAFCAANHDALCRFDVVLDGTDRFETKLALADAAIDREVAHVFAGVVGFEGQVMATVPGRSACLRCLFDEAPPPGAAPSCAELGILGPIAGIVAAMQVQSALRLIGGDDGVLNQIWVYDGIRNRGRTVLLRPAPDCRGCGDRRALRGVRSPDVGPPERVDAPVLDLRDAVCPRSYLETRRALEGLPTGGAPLGAFSK